MIESTQKLLKIVGVYYAPAIHFLSIVQTGQSAEVLFHDGHSFEEIKFSEAVYSEPVDTTTDGDIYKQNLSLIVAGDDPDLQEKILELKNSRPILKIEYDNGVCKLIGDKENYCKITDGFNSEMFITKRNLTFERLSHQAALFISPL